MMSQMITMAAKSIQRRLKSLHRDELGQDMIEYALLAAALVVTVAGFLPSTVFPSISTIFSKIVKAFSGV